MNKKIYEKMTIKDKLDWDYRFGHYTFPIKGMWSIVYGFLGLFYFLMIIYTWTHDMAPELFNKTKENMQLSFNIIGAFGWTFVTYCIFSVIEMVWRFVTEKKWLKEKGYI